METTDTHTASTESAPEKDSGGNSSGRLGRIAAESKGLVDDVKEWVELRVQLLQMEIEERIETVANQVISVIAVAVLALFTALFLLLGAAQFLGEWLGRDAWGYLVVGVVLALVTVFIHSSKPRFIKRLPDTGSNKNVKALPDQKESIQLTETAPPTSAGAKTDDSVEETTSKSENGESSNQ